MSRAWMPFYVADYLADTLHLGPLENGVYMFLIMHYWQTGSLPKDDIHLARIARMTGEEWNTIRPSIASFFDSEWRHRRVERELALAKEKRDKRTEAGRKGGKAKAALHKNPSKCSSNATILLEQNAANHNHYKEKEKEKEKAGKEKKGAAMAFVAIASPEWQAWQKVKPTPTVFSAEHHANGWWFPSLWPEQQKQEG
jgi:uncharacterized protein YdaU (DUF1376 family)